MRTNSNVNFAKSVGKPAFFVAMQVLAKSYVCTWQREVFVFILKSVNKSIDFAASMFDDKPLFC